MVPTSPDAAGPHPDRRPRHRRRSTAPAALAVLLCALLGGALVYLAVVRAPKPPPQPIDLQDGRYWALPDNGAAGRAMQRSMPVRIEIPDIEVDAAIIDVGTADDGSLDVPSLEVPHLAGWYRYGPSPGESGNSVIVGHVDTRAAGPAVFYQLGRLSEGSRIDITRADGSRARFTVDLVRSFGKNEFPAEHVYGASDRPSLRIITCGGEFDRSTSNYQRNVIVFATMIA